MKKTFIFVVIIMVISIVLPAANSVEIEKELKKDKVVSKTIKVKEEKNDSFKVLLSNTNEIVNVNVDEYLFGCVAAEMPVFYESEALKAQAVAAYTYALRKKEYSNNEYDLTNDYKTDQCYQTNEQIKEKWGENYEANREKIMNAVRDVLGKKLTFNGKTALSVYHAVSNGKTLTAKEVWGEDIPYLSSVDSSFDKLNEKYLTQVSINKNDFINDFSKYKITAESKIKTEKSENEKTQFLSVDGVKIPSAEISEKYALRSSSFDVDIKDENIVFSVYGYGHGVGMSQYGANCMAKSGSSYKEILLHYYSGCKIE